MRRIVTVLAVVALTPAGLAHADSAATTLVSVAADGTTPAGGSGEPSISADGRFVVFSSYASNLVPGDTNRRSDIFLHDMRTGATSRLTTGSVGDQANSDSYTPVISADGLFVAYYSAASNLVADDTNGTHDIFEYSRQWNTTTRVSVDSNGTQANGLSWQPAISADGRYVSFASDADNLVPGDTNHAGDVFVHDFLTSRTDRVSVNADGQQGDSVSRFARISADGRYVVYNSYASNLVPGDTNDESDIFLFDRQASTTTRIDLDPAGRQLSHGTSPNVYPTISADGRYIAYESGADNLVPNDVNYAWDVFLWDRATVTTALVSVATDGTHGDGGSGEPSISADGQHLAFESVAKNFAPGMPDFGYSYNVFVRDLAG
ncbi:TolB family protein [Kutzneria sp. CA-103260]|uniref:TolB family protein n=1 Tax=Kutzneria sp. CA-103260 TaxID=2802641 RepID=UPI001BA9C15B|nr:PD40 domain-containing protein [Kutzneria sp. CA-103260]QUQ63397.1 WD40 domain-containing protein [Kutzneria sp. CA-103260]